MIALWLGHESVETTQIYLDADLALKEQILAPLDGARVSSSVEVVGTAWSAGEGRSQTPAAITVFEGARLITGDGSTPIENSAFVIENNRFVAVGRRGDLVVPTGAKRIDLTGSGSFTRRDSLDPGIRVPMWTIKTFD